MSGRDPAQWTRARAAAMCALRALRVNQPFVFVGPAQTGSQTVIHGRVVGPGIAGGVEVAVEEHGCRDAQRREWSGYVQVLPLEEN